MLTTFHKAGYMTFISRGENPEKKAYTQQNNNIEICSCQ